MTAKDVICEALNLVGREDAAQAISGGGDLTEEVTRLKRACLTYLNAALDELARGYFPLDCEEELTSEDGRFAFADFARPPLEVSRVTSQKGKVKWRLSPDYLIADKPRVLVRYTYAPYPLNEDDEFSYPAYAVGARLVEYGMIAEYYLVLGDAASSSAWESKYRNEIENLLSRCRLRGRIPPRRWI